MQFALYNALRQSAEPGLKGLCLHCEKEVIAKCGEKNVWHWAHVKSKDCDAWTEPETAWHRDWKNKFGKDFSEIRIQKENVYHIADVLNKNAIVFEFQNSPISSELIKLREAFYGERMIWVINGMSFKDQFSIYEEAFVKHWKFNLLGEFEAVNYPGLKNVLIVEDWQVKIPEVRSFLQERHFEHHPQNKIYTLDLELFQYANKELLQQKINEDLLALYEKTHPKHFPMKVEFAWEHFRRSWQDAQRPVFVDFGEEFLLRVNGRFGKKYGSGTKILKRVFIDKYC
jgi:hypothetical protein